MSTLTTEELRARLQTGPLALFDVRGDVEFEKEHLPGAKTAPLGSLVFRVARVMDRDSFVVVYSAGADCDLGQQAAERLHDLGLRNVHWYAEGLSGWKDQGLPTQASPDAKVHTRGPVQQVRPIVVDRDKAYGGAFRSRPLNVEGAGG